VIFITHNVSHALPIGDSFTILSRGQTGGQFHRGDVDEAQLHSQMGGGDELHELTRELEALSKTDRRPPAPASGPASAPPSATDQPTSH
jgi:ABC-type sugar transport system ATPase subunit